ncbi:YdcF family protein [Acidovorax sp.]|uniref:YdcF family protein n=1 Tax=Acidovorax sp. TaxID=1872122 RepID=UPI0026064838|nr:YdcF family protein [Acidovorax sp.]
MLFALKKIFSALLMPPVSSILLAFVGLWMARRHPRTGMAVVVLSLLSVLALSWPPVADALVRSLERYPAVAPKQLPASKTQAIVVLGGGADTVAPEYGVDVLSRGARERVRYAVYLHQQTGLPILATGGSTGGTRAEALVMKDVVEREFKGRVRWTEEESLDTRSNAEKSAAVLKAAGIERIALVTHGWHMVRAAEAFERAGLQVLPAPMGFKGGQTRRLYRVLPRASALADSSLALHEWLGILAQRWSLDR